MSGEDISVTVESFSRSESFTGVTVLSGVSLRSTETLRSIAEVKKGICPIDHACRKFKYDPCKRIPAKAKALDFAKYDEHDYSL